MRGRVLVLAFFVVAQAAIADYQPTSLSFGGWTIESSEDLYAGRSHTSYPLMRMFDGDPSTAFVFSGSHKNKGDADTAPFWHGSRFAILISHRGGFDADGLRIMNGYNKSEATFKRNRRILALDIYDDRYDGKLIKHVDLSDRMGWHDIGLPSRRYEKLALVFRKFAEGSDPDVCVSELQLKRHGRPVDFEMPKTVEFTTGME